MRENFSVMQSLSQHTRVNADARIAKLLSFHKRLNEQPNVVQELKQWNLTLDKDLLDVKGRVLPAEKLVFGGNVIIVPTRGDWSREMQNKRSLVPKELKDWILIVLERDRRNIQVLLKLCRVLIL